MSETSNSILSEASDSGYRLHVTLMFSDLCDYTALSEAADPEEIDEIRQQLDALADAVVRKQFGYIAQAYGDGHLCVFGHPQPREDDTRRAIDAALELHAAVRAATWPRVPPGFEPRLHSAIHCGLVFVRPGTELHGRFQLSGDAVNTTARLCAVAGRDAILVSAAAISGCEEFFDAQAVPPISLKGKSAPQAAYLVRGRSTVRTRFEASTRRGLTAFVNRHEDLAALLERLQAGRAGRGDLLVVSGGAGIGKTRLFEEFASRTHTLGARVLYGTCENHRQIVPLEPFSQMLGQAFGVAGSAPIDEAAAEVERQCAALGPAVAAQTGTFLRLMALRPAFGDELSSTTVVHALSSLIAALTTSQALTLIVDDWQWADGASRTVLGQLRDVARERGVCLLVGMRATEPMDPTFAADKVLQLAPLADRDCVKVIATIRPDVWSHTMTDTVLARAGGNPLFLEELCRVLPPGSELRLDRVEVPHTVQAVIQTRIAALPLADRRLLGVAAVAGMEFSSAMLAELCGAPATRIQMRLEALCAEDLIYRADAVDSYRFKHGLTREVVYESVLIEERRQLHTRIAAMLERTADSSENQQASEALAHHYLRSGDLVRAVLHAERAGDRAMATSALDRACYHYHAAMQALDALPTTRESRRKWLALCAKWGLPFVFSPVHAASQLHVLHTAVAYADEVGDCEAKVRSWHWLGWAHYDLGNYAESMRYLQAGLELAERLGNDRMVAQLHVGLGQTQAAAGDYVAGLENLARGVASKREQARARSPRPGRVAQGYAFALASSGLVHADRGDFELSDHMFEEALSAVGGFKHAIEGSILGIRCIAVLWRGHWGHAGEIAQRGRHNAQHVNSAFNFATCSFYGAYADWEQTGAFEHIGRMRAAANWITAQQLELYAGADYAWLAHALRSHGDLDVAREYTALALRRATQGDPMGTAMAYRVLAQLGPAQEGSNPKEYQRECLELATRAGEARGSRHEAVKTCLLRAQSSQAAGDLVDARAWAERARDGAEGMAMAWHVDRAERLLASLPVRDPW